MRKKIVAILVLVAMCIALFAGCNLVTHNVKRDMNQVVAKAGDVNIRKGALKNAFLSTGYQFMQQPYNYGQTDAVNLTLELLIKRELLIEEALKSCQETDNAYNDDYYKLDDETKNSLMAQDYKKRLDQMLKCIKKDELKKIEWQVWKAEEKTLTSYEKDNVGEDLIKVADLEKGDVSKKDDITDWKDRATRVHPNKDAEDVEFVGTVPEYPNSTVNDPVEQKAFDSYVRKIKSLYNITLQEYRLSVVYGQVQDVLLTKYQKQIEESAVDYTDAQLYEKTQESYDNFLEQQKEVFAANPSAFVSMLGETKDSTMILYNALGGYAQVKNLLLEFDKADASILKLLQNQEYTDAQYNKTRDILASNIEIKDLRQKKILNPLYDTIYIPTDKVDGVWRSDDWYLSSDYKAGYNDKFIPADPVVSYMPLDSKKEKAITINQDGSVNSSSLINYLVQSIGKLTGGVAADDYYTAKPAEWINKGISKEDDAFIDLIYKFNGDTGMLSGSDPNYIVSPPLAPGETSKWVEEFQDVTNEVVASLIAKGATATLNDRFGVAVTDFGIHVIFVSYVTEKGNTSGVLNLNDLHVKNTPTYAMAEIIIDSLKANAYKQKTDELYSAAKESGGFSINSKAFKNFYKDDVAKW